MVELFGGCGGLAWGIREAANALGLGTDFLAVADVDPEALEAYATNFKPKYVLTTDVSKLVTYQTIGVGREATFAYPPEVLDDALRDIVGNVDLLVAGPPCQGHSNLNNRTRRDDPRNLLYIDSVAIAIALRPKAIIIENVPDVVNDHNGVVQTGIGLLEKAGYQLDGDVLSANDLGLPQTRKRYFLVGSLDRTPSLAGVEAVLGRRDGTDVRWAIEDVGAPSGNDPLAIDVELSPDNRRRIDWLFDNDAYDLPDEERPDCHRDGHTYGSVYGRLQWDQPAGTITTGFLTMGRGRFVHPGERRTLNPREAARLQGFPDSYRFEMKDGSAPSKKALTKWIGDAVPPILGYAAAMAVMPALLGGMDAEDLPRRESARIGLRARSEPEAKLRDLLQEQGLAFDSDPRRLPGAPTIVFRQQQVAVFAHGCYWHRHDGCELASEPDSNVDYWHKKFDQIRKRDQRAMHSLRKAGWHPVRVWECELETDPRREVSVLKALLEQRASSPGTAGKRSVRREAARN